MDGSSAAADFLQQRVAAARRSSLSLSQSAFLTSSAVIESVAALILVSCPRNAATCTTAVSAIANSLPLASLMEERGIESLCAVLGLKDDEEVLNRSVFLAAHGEIGSSYSTVAAALGELPDLTPIRIAVAVSTWRLFLFAHTVTCEMIVREVFVFFELLGPSVFEISNLNQLCRAVTRGTEVLKGDIADVHDARVLLSCLESSSGEMNSKDVASFRERLLFVASSYVGVPVLYTFADVESRELTAIAEDVLGKKAWSDDQKVSGLLLIVLATCLGSSVDSAMLTVQSIALQSPCYSSLAPRARAAAEQMRASLVLRADGSFPRCKSVLLGLKETLELHEASEWSRQLDEEEPLGKSPAHRRRLDLRSRAALRGVTFLYDAIR